jgi:hypothetical protein
VAALKNVDSTRLSTVILSPKGLECHPKGLGFIFLSRISTLEKGVITAAFWEDDSDKQAGCGWGTKTWKDQLKKLMQSEDVISGSCTRAVGVK